ncbi:hypothetical protein B0I35DRAFT_440592 [Stachybotrys elegans]|uniref:Xylanolytic transcriptional activator regulatory domain-containing protein n=1 Tax=Stachybotrys elegans TaxID=80388 RepID=A0A8K0SH89_9HYPO|nr:hypothetical protein B0I35DRAFT_440592 [Stachybotrys elegans]
MVPRAAHGNKTASSGAENELAPPQTNHHVAVQAQSQELLSIDPHHSFGYLDEASQYIGSMSATSSPDTEAERLVAANTLQELAKSLTTVRLQLVTDDMSTSSLTARYHVPSKQVGYGLISTFFRIMDRADVIMAKPSDEILRRVIFQPDSVSEPGWIVFINFILVNALLADKSPNSLAESLRANTRAALDDARIFLEPSQVSIQAFLLLASHGEDYATPNLSWMLMGHACRQVQALGPCQPSLGYREGQRQLSLFWSLFVLDKACSLAFGRPTQLPTTSYEHVQVPDFEYLLGYHPHIDSTEAPRSSEAPISTFGARFFIQTVELAKITGRVLAFLSAPDSETQRQAVLAELDAWDVYTGEVLLDAYQTEVAYAPQEQLDEMMLGIKAMKFQHLHMTVLILKKFAFNDGRLVAAARNALGLLRHLISTSEQVYNGVVWQLLYYPFTSFFVLFKHIVTSSQPSRIQEDLDLLAAVVSYFNSMSLRLASLASVSRRLERTASIFYRAACLISSGANSNEISDSVAEGCMLPAADGLATLVWNTDLSPTETRYEACTQTLIDQLRSQPMATSEFEGINVEGVLGCLEPDRRALKRQRTWDQTFNWFSWDTSYYRDFVVNAAEDMDIPGHV